MARPGPGWAFQVPARSVGGSGGGAELLASLSKLGFQPAQIEAFLPKALEFIKNHLPPELIERVMASLPGLAHMAGSEAK